MIIFTNLILNFVIIIYFFSKTLNIYNKYLILMILRGNIMNIINDEMGQGAAEYILLFGGVIVIAVAALMIYRAYFNSGAGTQACQDISKVRTSV